MFVAREVLLIVEDVSNGVQSTDDAFVSLEVFEALEQRGCPAASATGVARSIEMILGIPLSSTARV